MHFDPRRVVIATVAMLCLFQAIVGAGVVVGASSADAVDGSVGEMAQATPTPTNNTTIQQENPDDVDEAGDSDALQSYLSQQLAEQLGQSSVEISQGQYEEGKSILGDEYNSTLEKYIDVAGGTEADAEQFEAAAENQRELSTAAQQYNETYQEYQAARQAGNETRARELARELDRLAANANESARNLTDSYTRIENSSGADLSGAQQSATNTSSEISQQHEEVVSETFVRTALTVRAPTTTVSFDDPARVYGHLTLANGTDIANRSVEIQIGDHSQMVRTNSSGWFHLDYRPVTVPRETTNLSVAYRPASGSVYLGANASLNLSVSQTNATLTATATPSTAQFGDNVTVSGRAHVNGTPVAGARIRVTIGGTTVETVTTGSNGTYQATTKLPASVASGEQAVTAVVVPNDSAIRADSATAPLRVESTATTLRVNATNSSMDPEIRITGLLETVDDRPVPNRTVELRLNGTSVATVDTRANGTFSRVVTPQAGLSGPITVRAVYNEPTSNLEPSSARTSVDTDGETQRDTGPLSVELLGGSGAVVLSLLAIGWLVRRGEASVDEQASTPAPSPAASSAVDSGTDHIATAVGLLDDGDSAAAIQALYSAVRHSLRTGDDAQTHWEFYATASERLQPETAGTLERLTEAYEQVVYSPEGVEAERAAALLDDAESLLGDDGESS